MKYRIKRAGGCRRTLTRTPVEFKPGDVVSLRENAFLCSTMPNLAELRHFYNSPEPILVIKNTYSPSGRYRDFDTLGLSFVSGHLAYFREDDVVLVRCKRRKAQSRATEGPIRGKIKREKGG